MESTDHRSNLNLCMVDNVRLESIDEHMEESEVTLNEAQVESNKKLEILKEVKANLLFWKNEYNVRMVDEFIASDDQIYCPCFDCYHKQLMDLYGDIYGNIYIIQNYAIAVQIFDPFL